MNRRFFRPLFAAIALGGLLVTAGAKVPGHTRELLSQMPLVFEPAGAKMVRASFPGLKNKKSDLS